MYYTTNQIHLKIQTLFVEIISLFFQSDGLEYIRQECPDIFCLQETKCSENDLPKVCHVTYAN